MSNLKILYAASEISPFSKASTIVTDQVKQLILAMQDKGVDLRILVPRFDLINERKHRLHEVVRLSGTSVMMGPVMYQLVVKVASIPGTRCQIYFIDHGTPFGIDTARVDSADYAITDHDERLIFFCKATLATVRNLEWSPDIVHCHDWVTSLIPLYLKTTWRRDRILRRVKTIHTFYNKAFPGKWKAKLGEKASMLGIEEGEKLKSLASGTLGELIQTAMQHTDTLTKAEELEAKHPLKSMLREREAPHIVLDTAGVEAYYNLYTRLAKVR